MLWWDIDRPLACRAVAAVLTFAAGRAVSSTHTTVRSMTVYMTRELEIQRTLLGSRPGLKRSPR